MPDASKYTYAILTQMREDTIDSEAVKTQDLIICASGFLQGSQLS